MRNKTVLLTCLLFIACASAPPKKEQVSSSPFTAAGAKKIQVKLTKLEEGASGNEKSYSPSVPSSKPEDLIQFFSPEEVARFFSKVPKGEEEDIFVYDYTRNEQGIDVSGVLPTGGALSIIKAGKFKDGKYKGQESWLFVYEEPQDGQDCSGGTPQFLGFQRAAFDRPNSSVTLFANMKLAEKDRRLSFQFEPEKVAALVEKYTGNRVHVREDSALRLMGMESPPDSIVIDGVRFNSSEPVFNVEDDLWKMVYGTKSGEGDRSEIPYLPDATYGAIYQGDSYGSFFAIQPDGIRVPFNWAGVSTTKEKVDGVEREYSCHGYFGKGGEAPVAIDELPELKNESENELRKIASSDGNGHFFVWKSAVQAIPFYEKYKERFNTAQRIISGSEKEKLLGPEEFYKEFPVIVLPTPFGNRIYCEKYDFFEPTWVEPVIYLYSNATSEFRVEPGAEIKILETRPKLNQFWNVKTRSDGRLVNLDDKKIYPYLFWEGEARYEERSEEGFLVSRQEFFNFFRTKLRFLGLNSKEIRDFTVFWSKHIPNRTPYYKVRFLEQSEIESAAPLKIIPEPDTRIRIAAEIRGLFERVEVKPQILKRGPNRVGKVMVEWGVIPR